MTLRVLAMPGFSWMQDHETFAAFFCPIRRQSCAAELAQHAALQQLPQPTHCGRPWGAMQKLQMQCQVEGVCFGCIFPKLAGCK